MAHALDDLICGYCRAPIVDHSESSLKICVHRLTAARRDLAEKAQRAINDLWIDTRFDSQWRNGFEQCKGDALRELQRVFTESGVEVEKSDVDDERDDLTRDPMNVWAHGVSDMDFD